MYTDRRRLSARIGARSRQVRARSRIAMNTDLQQFAELLAELSDRELAALRNAADRSPQVVPGLLAWLEHAFGWEIDRRAGFDYRLAWPVEAIADEEVGASVAAARLLAEFFRGSGGSGAVVTVLERAILLIQAGPASSVADSQQ